MTDRRREGSRITVEYGADLLERIERRRKAEGYVSLSEFLRQVAMGYLSEMENRNRQLAAERETK